MHIQSRFLSSISKLPQCTQTFVLSNIDVKTHWRMAYITPTTRHKMLSHYHVRIIIIWYHVLTNQQFQQDGVCKPREVQLFRLRSKTGLTETQGKSYVMLRYKDH